MDKQGILENPVGAKLDLGCGGRKIRPDYIGVDLLDAPGVDLVGDVFEVLARFPPRSVERVFSSHFFEHIDDIERLLSLIAAVLVPGGELEIVVPHFSNPYFYSDPTHKHTFGLYTFGYFINDYPYRRRVPTYGRDVPFRLADASLGFKSAPPFYVRHGLKVGIGKLVNATRWLTEFYEENLCYLVPCYEIRYVLERSARDL